MAESGTHSSDLERWLVDGTPLPERWRRFAGLTSLSRCFFLSTLSFRTKSPLLFVLPTASQAREAVENLKFFLGEKRASRVHYLPSLEFDYHKGLIPGSDKMLERNVGLYHALNDPGQRIFVTTVAASLQKLLPAETFLDGTVSLTLEQEVDRDALMAQLLQAGYQRQPIAYDPGVFSVRGGVMDIFSPLYSHPFRIEFFGDFIEQMRFFESSTQRSLDAIEKVAAIPVNVTRFPRGKAFEAASLKVKERLDSQGVEKSERVELLDKMQEGSAPLEAGLLFPLFSEGSAALSDYFGAETLAFWPGEKETLLKVTEEELPRIEKSFSLFEEALVPIAEQSDLFLDEAEFLASQKTTQTYFFENFEESAEVVSLKNQTISFGLEKNQTGQHALEPFAERFKEWMDKGYRIHVACHTRTHAERAQYLFDGYGIRSRVFPDGTPVLPNALKSEFDRLNLWVGHLSESVVLPEMKLVWMSEEAIFGHKKRVGKHAQWDTKSAASKALQSFRDLKVNDFIVHKDHGIGRYLGLKSMAFLGAPNDYVLLEYRDGDKLYVPVYRLNLIQKYVGGESARPVLDKLGGERWAKARKKAERAVAELAAELIEVQARRKLIPAHAFSPPSADLRQFEMAFPFDETPDQMKAIDNVMQDLSKSHPMDRLVVGDVGYGKTEVAMRAAFRAILDGKQVAILVPTTILAFQHYENFLTRFKDTAARVEMVSRLRSTAQNKAAIEKLKKGKVDIIIGTHRLLSSDVEFSNIGLVVIDEEHRFGVVHKEKLKKRFHNIHVLSMTATPIPRTLNMAMSGIKDISLINSPPPDRLSIRTFVCRASGEVITEALTNELGRNGQVYFLHNRVQTIHRRAEELQEYVPNAKLTVVHGQMDPATLEKKMLEFYRGDYQILVTTTIIESGLDIPNANTLILDDAHKLGLAQAYQLRGRVGRSDRRAYCYLLIPEDGKITEDAKQRLEVLQRYSNLGSGFNIASHDLEIRGSGDLLGKDQSGNITAIGVDLYFELLEENINYLKGKEKKVEIEPEIHLKLHAFFPNDYLPDVSERITIYRRLSSVDSEEQVAEIETEIRDRFGNLPEEVVNLLGLMKIKLYLKPMHVTHLKSGPKRASLQFAKTTPIASEKVVELVQKDPKRYSLTPDHKLVFETEEATWPAILREIQRISEELT